MQLRLSKHRLRPRERQVIRLVAERRSNKEMAIALGISVRTVETYRARMMLKLDLRSIAEVTRYAVRNKII
jgi:DNA-binding CsgD family transcriptional regulator